MDIEFEDGYLGFLPIEITCKNLHVVTRTLAIKAPNGQKYNYCFKLEKCDHCDIFDIQTRKLRMLTIENNKCSRCKRSLKNRTYYTSYFEDDESVKYQMCDLCIILKVT